MGYKPDILLRRVRKSIVTSTRGLGRGPRPFTHSGHSLHERWRRRFGRPSAVGPRPNLRRSGFGRSGRPENSRVCKKR